MNRSREMKSVVIALFAAAAFAFLTGCEDPPFEFDVEPIVSLSTWTQPLVSDPIEVQWTVSGGSPRGTAEVEAQFVVALSSGIHGYFVRRVDTFGDGLSRSYTDSLGPGGEAATSVTLSGWQFR